MKTFFSDRLKAARGSRSQRDFAAFLGVKQTTYSRWELAQTEPSFDGLMNICGRLGVTADWLLGLTDSRGGGVSVTATGGSAVAAQSPGAMVSAKDAEVERLRGEVAALERALRLVAGKGDGRG